MSERARRTAPVLTPMDGSDDADTASIMTEATEDTDDFPAFSPEGMISWMFERCNRRYEDATQAGDTVRSSCTCLQPTSSTTCRFYELHWSCK